ncbi:MAG: hypothetical protein AAGF79_21180, partial [Pseudomonadota bacterium]
RLDRSTDGMVNYNANSAMQQQSIVTHANAIRALAERIEPSGDDIRIVDLGCGPGTSTLLAMRPAVETLIARFPQATIHVGHADVPTNDWNALSAIIFGPDGYATMSDKLRVEAYLGSFYATMPPVGSVDIAMCFAASHWLSRDPGFVAPGTIFFADLQGDKRQKMDALAQADWTQFLNSRAGELRPGGLLYVSTLGAIPDPDEINGVCSSARYLYRAIQVVAQSMADDGLIDQDALDRFIFPLWFLTAEEARRAIEASPTLSEAFEIETIEVVPAELTQSDLFIGLRDDPKAYGEAYSGYVRGFGESSLLKYLFNDAAHETHSARDLVDIFFERYARLNEENVGTYKFETWYLNVQLRRT